MSSMVSMAGGIFSGIGQIYAQESEANTLRSQAHATQVAGQEAQTAAEFDAAFTEQQAKVREDQIRRYGERIQAKATAMAGSEGVDVGSGSPVMAAMDNAANIETDAMRAQYTGETRAKELRYQGSVAYNMAQYNAQVMLSESTAMRDIALVGGFGTLLSGAGASLKLAQEIDARTASDPNTGVYGSATPASGQGPGNVRGADTAGRQPYSDSTGQSLLWD